MECLKQFHIALDSIRHHADFYALAVRLRTRSANVFAIENIGPEDRPTVDRFRAAGAADGTVTFEVLYASICFHLEEFLRELGRFALEDLNQRFPKYDQISKAVFDNHLVATGRIMSIHQQDARASKLDMNTYAKNLAGCIPGESKYKFNSDVFSFFLRSASSEDVERLFKPIGFKIDWDVFGRNLDMRKHFQGGGTREVAKHVRRFLDDFVSLRNRIVHRGGGYVAVSDAEIERTVAFFRIFSSELSTAIGNYCQTYKAVAS